VSEHAVYIFDALRTPRAKGRAAKDNRPGGALSRTPPQTLVTSLIAALEARSPGIKPRTDRLSLGCVGQTGAQGGHIALVSRLAAGLPDRTAVRTLNNNCVSGLSAVMDAALWLGRDGGLGLAGGVEMLSQVGFLADKAPYYSDPKTIADLRWAPPVLGAELIATIDGIEKSELDAFTHRSHQRAHAAWERGFYASHVVPVRNQAGETLIARDALIRPHMDAAALNAMLPAFAAQGAAQGAAGFDAMMLRAFPDLPRINHVHSVANCPGMADGAAMILLGTAQTDLTPRARIVDYIETAGDPVLQLTAGFEALEMILARQSLQVKDIERWEFMEAFAAPPVKFLRDYAVDPDHVNVNGGHLAMGHPMGATGAILLAALLCELEASGTRRGMVVAQAGGGLGAAMLIERV
jgi:acetyl-CoA acetyltransferase family protein